MSRLLNTIKCYKHISYLPFLLLLSLLFYRTSTSVVDLDIWHEMATAKVLLESNFTILNDVFSYTPTLDPTVHHEWLNGLIALQFYNSIGLSSFVLIKYFLMLNFAAICFILIKKTTSSPAHIFTILLLILLLSDWGFGAFRAQMFTFILIGLTLYGLLRYAESSSKFILILALTFPLWINIHGGAILSIILIGAYSIEELARKKIPYILILSALIMTALISINPWGLSFYIYLKNSLFMERPLISEWHPIWKTSEDYKLFIFIFFIVFFLAYWKKIDWKKNRGFACILLMMIMSIKSARFLPFFALTIAAFFPYYLKEVEFGSLLNRIWDKLNQNKLAVPLVFGVSILLTVLAFGQKPFTAKVPSEKIEHYPLIYPVGATKFLKDTNFRGNILTSFNTGSYVLWNLYPNSKVFIDSRYEVAYPETRMQESDKFYNKYEGWEKILNTYPHTVVLVAKTDKVYSELSNLDYLNLIFSDSIYSIFEIKPH